MCTKVFNEILVSNVEDPNLSSLTYVCTLVNFAEKDTKPILNISQYCDCKKITCSHFCSLQIIKENGGCNKILAAGVLKTGQKGGTFLFIQHYQK